MKAWKPWKAVIVALIVQCVIRAEEAPHARLLPLPSSLKSGQGELILTSSFDVRTPLGIDTRLRMAIERAQHRLERKTGLSSLGPDEVGKTRLIVRVANSAEQVQRLDEDESYSLSVTPESAEIDAENDLGAMHGLETLLQLVTPHGDGYILPAVSITDRPRFRWRGLMIDCSRHFEPLPILERTLDAMAAVKLNVLHWHLTDDQGFRIESKEFPLLTAKGSDGFFYTQAEARELVAYAHSRGIRIVPEFDIPGHSTALLVAYPKLSSGSVPKNIRREFGISLYAIDPTKEETYRFLRRFLKEMATIFPDRYVHIGGDETKAPDWSINPSIVDFKRRRNLADDRALQAYFNSRVETILDGIHKRMIGWDEILSTDLRRDVTVQSWRGGDALIKTAQQGHGGILSAPYYLDRMEPASAHYLADPLNGTERLNDEQKHLVLGGEACMWGEHIDQDTIDSRIWPRTAAIAERFWSPAEIRGVGDMYSRLDSISIELERLGLRHLSSRDAILRSLDDTEKIDALRTFASVLEPVSHHNLTQAQHPTQRTELNNFVDAVRPDPPSKHSISTLAMRVLTKAPGAEQATEELDGWFHKVHDVVPEIKLQLKISPQLIVLEQRADELAFLMEVGREALRFLSSHQQASAEWQTTSLRKVKESERSDDLVVFTFIAPLRQLIIGASSNTGTRTEAAIF